MKFNKSCDYIKWNKKKKKINKSKKINKLFQMSRWIEIVLCVFKK